MAQINPKITIRSVYFGMLLLSAAVMILAVRLAVASSWWMRLKRTPSREMSRRCPCWVTYMTTGEGVPQNYTEAAQWYRMSAERGCLGAGQSGSHVCQWTRRSPKRYRGSAMVEAHVRRKRGFADAQVKLGIMYFMVAASQG